MKYDRLQETLRYITPGLYLLALILLIHFEDIMKDDSIKGTITQFSAIFIVLLPFVGFVLGYFIECLMTLFERLLYCFRLSRPSRIILHGKSKAYSLSEDLRKAILKGADVNDNETANRYQQAAKQIVGSNDVVIRHYYQSIMSRHILGAQLIASIYYLAFAGGWSWFNLLYSAILIALLLYFWYHQNCVYMKYLFAEYGKKLLNR